MHVYMHENVNELSMYRVVSFNPTFRLFIHNCIPNMEIRSLVRFMNPFLDALLIC